MNINPSAAIAAVGIPGSRLALVCGLLFIARCEFGNYQAGKQENWLLCWSGGASVAGVATGVNYARKSGQAEGFKDGYWTYNPTLKKPEEDAVNNPTDKPE